jgi:hypothetical protein
MIAAQKPLPKKLTAQEQGLRYVYWRVRADSADEATRLVFVEQVKRMRRARPEWDGARIAQELRDRGYGVRYGVEWTIRVATETVGR